MAIGAGEKRPYVINDSLQIATVMSATGSFDHRAIDGADGAKLMQAFKGWSRTRWGCWLEPKWVRLPAIRGATSSRAFGLGRWQWTDWDRRLGTAALSRSLFRSRRSGAMSYGTTSARGTPDRSVIRVTAMPAEQPLWGDSAAGDGPDGLACGSFASRRTKARRSWSPQTPIKFPGAMAVGDELSVYVDLLKQAAPRCGSRPKRSAASGTATKRRSWRRASSPSSRSTTTEKPRPVRGRGGTANG